MTGVSVAERGLTSIDKRLDMLPESLTFTKTLRSDNRCYSVNITADGHRISGSTGRVEIRDTIDGKVKFSRNMKGSMVDMKRYGDHLYGALLNDNQLAVVRYDTQLNNRKEVISIPYQTNKFSQIDVRYGTIAVVDYDNKLIQLYTTDGGFVGAVTLKGCNNPSCVRLLMDGCVLVTDYGPGSVTKYQTDGSGIVVWRCGQLQHALGLDVDEWGLIYICEKSTIYLISPEG